MLSASGSYSRLAGSGRQHTDQSYNFLSFTDQNTTWRILLARWIVWICTILFACIYILLQMESKQPICQGFVLLNFWLRYEYVCEHMLCMRVDMCVHVCECTYSDMIPYNVSAQCISTMYQPCCTYALTPRISQHADLKTLLRFYCFSLHQQLSCTCTFIQLPL